MHFDRAAWLPVCAPPPLVQCRGFGYFTRHIVICIHSQCFHNLPVNSTFEMKLHMKEQRKDKNVLVVLTSH